MAKGGKGGSDGSIRGNKRDNLLTGTDGADVIDGNAGNDTLLGLAGDDTILGGDGDDSIEGGLGSDVIDGGAGTDSVTFSGARDDYTVVQIDAVTVEITGPDGSVDTVANVESFNFSDMTQNFAEVLIPRDPNLVAGTLTTSATSLIEGEQAQLSWSIASDGIIDAETSMTQLVIATAPDMTSVVSVVDLQSAGAIATGESATFSTTLDTTGLAPGTYFIAAVADSGDALAESNETDNVTNWVQITVEPQVVSYRLDAVSVLSTSDFDLNPDYGPYGPTGAPDARIDFSLTATNDGNVGPTEFELRIWLSTDDTLSGDDIELLLGDPYSYSPTLVSIGLGETATFDLFAELPEHFPQGDYQVIAAIQEYDPYGSGSTGPYDDPSDNILTSPDLVPLVGGWTYGTDADELFVGTQYREKFDAGAGNDTLTGDVANDIFYGGDGIDTLDLSALSYGMTLFGEYDPMYSTNHLTLEINDPYVPYDPNNQGVAQDIEAVIGTAFDDILVAYATTVTDLRGGDGNDTVMGSYGDDVIDGGAGDDMLGGIFGNDVITTGDGFDMIFVDRNPDGAGGFTGHGHDVVTDFDVMQDLLLVEFDPYADPGYDPFADLTQTAEGALLTMADDSSILLMGVDVFELNTNNLGVIEEGYVSVLY